MNRFREQRAFTLVELLVVIAIISVLVGLLLPAVQSAREAARRLTCLNNLTQLALAVQNYDAAYRAYPAGVINATRPIVSESAGYHHNWLTQLLPYMEEQVTYQHVDFGVGVYHERNAPVRLVRIRTHLCPSDPDAYGDKWISSYAGVHHDLDEPIDENNHGIFILNRSVRYEDVRDGTTHTLLIGEKVADNRLDLGWMSGTHATLRNTGIRLNGMKRGADGSWTPAENSEVRVGGFASHHPGGVNFAFADGHTGFISNSLPLDVLQQLAHRADGKLLTNRDF